MMYAKWMLLLVAGLLGACGGGGGTPAAAGSIVTVSWSASRASGVNATGGGYRVYWSTTPGFVIGPDANVLDVPWPGSGITPTSASLRLPAGDYYFKVVAYAATGGGVESAPSAEIAVAVY